MKKSDKAHQQYLFCLGYYHAYSRVMGSPSLRLTTNSYANAWSPIDQFPHIIERFLENRSFWWG